LNGQSASSTDRLVDSLYHADAELSIGDGLIRGGCKKDLSGLQDLTGLGFQNHLLNTQ